MKMFLTFQGKYVIIKKHSEAFASLASILQQFCWSDSDDYFRREKSKKVFTERGEYIRRSVIS